MARSLFVAVFLSLYIIVVGIPLLLWTVISRNPAALYWGGVKGVMFFVRSVGVRVKVSGLERIPSGACLFAANHTSSADAPAVVGAIPRRIAILLKKSLFSWPIAGQAFTLVASLEKATEAMKEGQSFLIYPEGTRSPDGRLQEFKRGAVVMAIKAGVPIVPMVCAGAQKVMEKKSLVIRPGVITVEFLEPIDASAYTFEQRDELNKRVRAAMAAALPDDQKPLA